MDASDATTQRLPFLLVVLPGMDGTCDLFAPFLDALGDRDRVLAIAYPRDRTMDYDELASWVAKRLPDRDFTLLGESFSGPVAALVAATQPAHLRALILCATFVRNPRPWARVASPLIRFLPMTRAWARLASPFLLGVRPGRELRQRFVGAVGDMPSRVMQARLASVLAVDASESLAKVTVPTLCLRATRDVLVPAKAGEWIRKVLPPARVLDVAGPHGLLQASPRACALSVRAFLDALPTGQPPSGLT
jgi:pimeloyl-ACP methyl ester carboxylesterase